MENEIEKEALAPEVVEKPVETKPEVETQKKSIKRVLTGRVTSNLNDKTVVLQVVRQVSHPLYKKYYKLSKKFMAHDEKNECNIGDIIKVKECRPLSKHKRWDLIEIIERAK